MNYDRMLVVGGRVSGSIASRMHQKMVQMF